MLSYAFVGALRSTKPHRTAPEHDDHHQNPAHRSIKLKGFAMRIIIWSHDPVAPRQRSYTTLSSHLGGESLRAMNRSGAFRWTNKQKERWKEKNKAHKKGGNRSKTLPLLSHFYIYCESCVCVFVCCDQLSAS